MALNLMASAGPKLAAVGAQGTAFSHIHSSIPTAGFVFHVPGQRTVSSPLRSSAIVRCSPLPWLIRSGGARAGADGEQNEEMVYQVLSWCAANFSAMLPYFKVPKEETEARDELKKFFSEVAATSKGDHQVGKIALVRDMIRGVHRLIELAYTSCDCKRVTAPTTEEAFVDYFMNLGHVHPELSTGLAVNESMGQYPDAVSVDRCYLASMMASMKLATHVGQAMRSNPEMVFPQLPPVDVKESCYSPFPDRFPWEFFFG